MKDCKTLSKFPAEDGPIPLPAGATAVHTVTYLDAHNVTRFVEGCRIEGGGVVPPDAWPADASANGFIRVWFEADDE
jgi:hypothetical protein